MSDSKTIFAVISEVDNSLASVWLKESDADNDCNQSNENYNTSRIVVSGTIDEIIEITGSSREEIEKTL